MPKSKVFTYFNVGLVQEDKDALLAMSAETQRPHSDILREAIHEYFDAQERKKQERKEKYYIDSLNNVANRLAGLIVQGNQDTALIFDFLYQALPKELFEKLEGRVGQRMKKKLSDADQIFLKGYFKKALDQPPPDQEAP